MVLECFAIYKKREAPGLAPIFHINFFLAVNFGPGGGGGISYPELYPEAGGKQISLKFG